MRLLSMKLCVRFTFLCVRRNKGDRVHVCASGLFRPGTFNMRKVTGTTTTNTTILLLLFCCLGVCVFVLHTAHTPDQTYLTNVFNAEEVCHAKIILDSYPLNDYSI